MEAFIAWTVFVLSLPFITASKPQSTVVLWENNTTHNAIDVSTSQGTLSIDKPYYFTTLSASDQSPSPIAEADPIEMNKKFGALVNALPEKAVSFVFYFEPTKSELTESSKAQVDELVQAIKKHEPAVIDIIGHTDREGDSDKNYELALQRAKEVEKFLLDQNVVLLRSNVVSYGEDDPIVATEDGVAEPKNRRVEVIVR